MFEESCEVKQCVASQSLKVLKGPVLGDHSTRKDEDLLSHTVIGLSITFPGICDLNSWLSLGRGYSSKIWSKGLVLSLLYSLNKVIEALTRAVRKRCQLYPIKGIIVNRKDLT